MTRDHRTGRGCMNRPLAQNEIKTFNAGGEQHTIKYTLVTSLERGEKETAQLI